MKTKKSPAALVVVLVAAACAAAGCVDDGTNDGASIETKDAVAAAPATASAGPTPPDESAGSGNSSSAATNGGATNSTTAAPVTYSWDGMAPMEACASGTCADATFAVADGSEIFDIPSEAQVITVIVTWDDPGGRSLTVHLTGPVESTVATGDGPLEITLPVIDDGDLLILVRHYAVGETPTYASTVVPFTAEITVA